MIAATLEGADRALFFSDVHLGESDPVTAAKFLSTIARWAGEATHIFVLGDLFDAWIGDDGADAVGELTLLLMARWSREGKRVFVMPGNRDFLMDAPVPGLAPDRQLAARCGVQMLPDPCVVSLFGEPVLLAHGDAFCTRDEAYQRFRQQARDPQWQAAFLAAPLEARAATARHMRAQSEEAKGEKAMEIMDVTPQAVLDAMTRHGVRILIHGHTHRPGREALILPEMGRPGWRQVLPDWQGETRGGALRVDAEGFELYELSPPSG